ncbi:DUF5677 domain-containing protein [Pseudomonas sp. FW305-E2]|uniref:DUF5677 domain-containing protein n=1 Tax=Pseudomonas sp. FW305-E2 TaxID=2075558 RepID=UPI003532218B
MLAPSAHYPSSCLGGTCGSATVSGGTDDRWRTLHETSLITKFICEGDEDLSTRFTDYQSVLQLKRAIHYNANNDLQLEAITPQQIERFELEQNRCLR